MYNTIKKKKKNQTAWKHTLTIINNNFQLKPMSTDGYYQKECVNGYWLKRSA